MNFNLTSLAKLFLFCFGFINITHVFSLFGILSATTPAPSPDSWWLDAFLFSTCMILPVAAVLMDNYTLYVTVSGVSLFRIVLEALRVFTWTTNFFLMLAPLYALAAFLSVILAVENVASKASAELLSLEWSQF